MGWPERRDVRILQAALEDYADNVLGDPEAEVGAEATATGEAVRGIIRSRKFAGIPEAERLNNIFAFLHTRIPSNEMPLISAIFLEEP